MDTWPIPLGEPRAQGPGVASRPVCRYWMRGHCRDGMGCSFAHPPAELYEPCFWPVGYTAIIWPPGTPVRWDGYEVLPEQPQQQQQKQQQQPPRQRQRQLLRPRQRQPPAVLTTRSSSLRLSKTSSGALEPSCFLPEDGEAYEAGRGASSGSPKGSPQGVTTIPTPRRHVTLSVDTPAQSPGLPRRLWPASPSATAPPAAAPQQLPTPYDVALPAAGAPSPGAVAVLASPFQPAPTAAEAAQPEVLLSPTPSLGVVPALAPWEAIQGIVHSSRSSSCSSSFSSGAGSGVGSGSGSCRTVLGLPVACTGVPAKRPVHPLIAAEHPKYKTKLCSSWLLHEPCTRGQACPFAHGEGELRGGGAAAAARKRVEQGSPAQQAQASGAEFPAAVATPPLSPSGPASLDEQQSAPEAAAHAEQQPEQAQQQQQLEQGQPQEGQDPQSACVEEQQAVTGATPQFSREPDGQQGEQDQLGQGPRQAQHHGECQDAGLQGQEQPTPCARVLPDTPATDGTSPGSPLAPVLSTASTSSTSIGGSDSSACASSRAGQGGSVHSAAAVEGTARSPAPDPAVPAEIPEVSCSSADVASADASAPHAGQAAGSPPLAEAAAARDSCCSPCAVAAAGSAQVPGQRDASLGEALRRQFPAFVCPLSKELFKDPVVAADGHTYERAHIEDWLHKQHKSSSPCTGGQLAHSQLLPNTALRMAMATALEICGARR